MVLIKSVYVFCRLDTDLLDALFGLAAPPTKNPVSQKPAALSSRPVPVAILDSKRAQNFTIQLRALGLTRQEICGALLEGQASVFLISCKLWVKLPVLYEIGSTVESARHFYLVSSCPLKAQANLYSSFYHVVVLFKRTSMFLVPVVILDDHIQFVEHSPVW
jgi:hypothetical protein